MAQKECRWFQVREQTLFVYDHPDPKKATMMSFTQLSDLPYYRRTFTLRKVEVPFASC